MGWLADLRVRLSLDSSQFTQAIEGANKKAAKVFGKGFGVGRTGFMAFDAVSNAIEESNGSFKQFSKNMAATGAMVGGVIGIAKAWTFLADKINEVSGNLDEFGVKAKYGTFLWSWGIGGLEVDEMKRQERRDRDRQDAISRAAKAIKGPDAEERVLRWMRRPENAGAADDIQQVSARLRMEQAKDEAEKARASLRSGGADNFARIGLGLNQTGVANFAQQTANNTSKLVQLFEAWAQGNLQFVPTAY